MNPVPPSSHIQNGYVAGQDRSLWSVDHEAFETTGMGAWTQLPVPNGDENSGPSTCSVYAERRFSLLCPFFLCDVLVQIARGIGDKCRPEMLLQA